MIPVRPHHACPLGHPFKGEGVAHPEGMAPVRPQRICHPDRMVARRPEQVCHPERSDPAFSCVPHFGAPGRAERDPSSLFRNCELSTVDPKLLMGAPGAAVAPGSLAPSWASLLRNGELKTVNLKLLFLCFLISDPCSLIPVHQ